MKTILRNSTLPAALALASITVFAASAHAANTHQAGKSTHVEAPIGPPVSLALRPDPPTPSWGWERTRRELEERGVGIHAYLNDQRHFIVKGGLDTEGWGRNAASLDVLVTFDFEGLGLIDSAEALLHLQSNWGDGLNDRSGSLLQVNDDADGSIGGHVAQLWYRHHFLDRRMSLTVGFLDYQTIIDRNAYANSEDKQFLHQALDNNPLLPLNIGLGATLTFRPTTWYTLTLGVSDAQSVLYKPGFSTAFHDENWWFAYLEHGLHLRFHGERGPVAGNYRVGAFYDPRPRVNVNRSEHEPPLEGHDYGLYVSVDQCVYRESHHDEQGLGVFGRFGYRTSETNRLARFWSGGVSYTGLLPGRDADVLGLGFAWIEASDDFRRRSDPALEREVIYELYYAMKVTEWLVITPDIQYIDNPGAAGAFGHTVVAGVRLRASL